jgi:hypothetical protein
MTVESVSAVLDRHADELMEIDGVTGVYVGAREDSSLCLRVLLLEGHEASRSRIPKVIEGVPVEIEPTDAIRPL